MSWTGGDVDVLANFFKKIAAGLTAEPVWAWRAGYDCGLNGANTTNCHPSYFGNRQLTQSWEHGNRTALGKSE